MDCANNSGARREKGKEIIRFKRGDIALLVSFLSSFKHSFRTIFPFLVCQTRRKSYLNCHWILALDTPGRSLALALIQSYNNRGEIPFAGKIDVLSLLCTYTIKYKPCFPQYHCPSSPFLFQKGRIHQKATSLFCHLWVCCTSISFPSTITRFWASQFPLLSISLHLFFAGF